MTCAGVLALDASIRSRTFSLVSTCASPLATAAVNSLSWDFRFSYHQAASSASEAKAGTARLLCLFMVFSLERASCRWHSPETRSRRVPYRHVVSRWRPAEVRHANRSVPLFAIHQLVRQIQRGIPHDGF